MNPRRSRVRRSRRNMPWGSSMAEVAHRSGSSKGNPRRRSGNGGIVLGTLEELVIEHRNGVKRLGKGSFRGAHLAWLPARRNFAIVFKRGRQARPETLPDDIRRLHQTFHEADPSAAGAYEWPDQCPPLKQLGLIRSITYAIPPSLQSPGKKGFNWVHAFGDHGESGHGPLTREKRYPDGLKPMAVMDRNGNIFIVRRPSNKYHVTKWIYW